MEGINDGSVNQASVHTAVGCHISDLQSVNNATGVLVGGSDCASAETNNGGCGQKATSLQNTYGASFNSNGGGVYASMFSKYLAFPFYRS
ncbi:MAG TPA: hypothetical protein VGO47_14825, partial [Chlamydiales bacterium]|nr:hypothetical protein [Chlamydiales bacterium]